MSNGPGRSIADDVFLPTLSEQRKGAPSGAPLGVGSLKGYALFNIGGRNCSLVGIGSREPGFDSWSSRSLEAFPKDFVIELGRNAVFSRKIEAAGFLRPVLRVMSGLQVGTGSELDLVRVQPQWVSFRSVDATALKVHAPDDLMSKTSAIGRA